MKGEIIVSALKRPGRWQDDLRVAGRLVNVDIDGGHELEPRQSAIQFAAVWCRQHRIPAMSDERFNLTFAFGQDFFRQRGDRQLAGKLRQFAHACVPASKTAAWRKAL